MEIDIAQKKIRAFFCQTEYPEQQRVCSDILEILENAKKWELTLAEIKIKVNDSLSSPPINSPLSTKDMRKVVFRILNKINL